MPDIQYKFKRSDFKPLPVTLEHLDIHLNFRTDNVVEATCTSRMRPRSHLSEIVLDARDIEIDEVVWLGTGAKHASPKALKHSFDKEASKLTIHLPSQQGPDHAFSIRTKSRCVPLANILEGIYLDTTPEGCPQQYMSQYQQWGFQRVMPVYDDCTAKCTMRTTLEADARYTHLISNGDVDRTTNPDGKPVLKKGDPSRQCITYINDIPMAPYLFISAVGTWDMLADEVTYPSGRTVRLEYLVPPGRTEAARVPMQILKDSVLWVHKTQGYEYTREVYRTICMEKSNFGGMENVGNTTIITEAALVDEYTGDRRLEYAHGVIVHEFEHNQCGSEVTMETPFDMWLNEAYTVDVERQFVSDKIGKEAMRLDQIDSMWAPLGGPLAVEDAGKLGNIVRTGFNDSDELVDGVTYVKAAEVIRMLRLVVGTEKFRQARDLYFSRYKGSNANTEQFLACFTEVSGRDLTQFQKEWLYTIGYPKVVAKHTYDPVARRLDVTLSQTRSGTGGLFHIPFQMAAVDANGHDIPGTVALLELRDEEKLFSFRDVPEPAFVSMNRDYSFYGTFTDQSATRDQRILQARLDPNLFCRVDAMMRVTDEERVRLINDPKATPSAEWIAVYEAVLNDTTLPLSIQPYILRIDEQSLDRSYIAMPQERYDARERLLKAVAKKLKSALIKRFNAVDTYSPDKSIQDGLANRQLKGTLLRIIVSLNTSEVWTLAAEHYKKAHHISDKTSALHSVMLTDHPDRAALLKDAYKRWHEHLNAYTGYLRIVASGVHDDVFAAIHAEEKKKGFRIEHPTYSRALYLPMAMNNKMLWTDAGISWMRDTVIRLAEINENTAIRLISPFQLVHQFPAELKSKVLTALNEMATSIDVKKYPSIGGRLQSFLTP